MFGVGPMSDLLSEEPAVMSAGEARECVDQLRVSVEANSEVRVACRVSHAGRHVGVHAYHSVDGLSVWVDDPGAGGIAAAAAAVDRVRGLLGRVAELAVIAWTACGSEGVAELEARLGATLARPGGLNV